LRPQKAVAFHIIQLAFCAIACALLTGCFFVPGHFQSELEIRRDGRFSFAYTGEVIFLFPSQSAEGAWDNEMAKCFTETHYEARACSAAEIASERDAFEAERRRKKRDGEDFARLIGYNPLDAKANERLAADLMLYPEWKKVEYLGEGRFYVEYGLAGMLDRDFAFPVVPQIQLAMPFVNVARDRAGIVNVSAAGLSSQQLRRLIIGQTPRQDIDDPIFAAVQSNLRHTSGKFSIITDAKITSTNGKLSESKGLQHIEWAVDGQTKETPKIQLAIEP
jgi:hypothetical protein